jgi:3',5'-nucleoside bisphosphate phosphatase
MPKADLHIHTTASDGVLSPTRTVEEAKRVGLAALAITDHDTIEGLEEGITAGKANGIEVVPAIELSTSMGPIEIHILGYFLDWHCVKLRQTLTGLQEARLERGKKMVEKLQALGVPVTLDRVLEIAGSGSIGRPHIAVAICETGMAMTIHAAFGRYLVRGAPAFVERYKISPFEAVSLIADAGGVACLAHPNKSKRDDLIPDLVKSGLRALEVYHSDHTAEVSRRYQALARRYGLIVTGGSDAHGFDPKCNKTIGSVRVPMDAVIALREASNSGH